MMPKNSANSAGTPLLNIVVCYNSRAGFVFGSWSGCLFLWVYCYKFFTNQIARTIPVISHNQSTNLFCFYPFRQHANYQCEYSSQ